MSTIALQLPNNFVEFETKEMEYVDGAGNLVTYNWGYAINLNTSECSELSYAMSKAAISTGAIGGIGAVLGGFIPGAGPIVAATTSAATVLGTAYVSNIANDLSYAAGKKGATFCVNRIGSHNFMRVNVWQ